MSHENLNPSAPDRPKRVAIVLSNPAVSSTTGWPVGFWWAELTHPYFKFTEAGGVAVRLSAQGDGTLDLRISDTGTGIAPDRLDSIFKPFE